MPIADPDERARRAVIRAVDNLTELVSIVIDDPSDQNPSPLAFQCDPDNLFDLTFSRVGIDNSALISGFITGLKIQLPEFKAKIQELFKDLKPGVQIGLVWNVLRREIAKPLAGDAASNGTTKGGATKTAAKKAGKKGGS